MESSLPANVRPDFAANATPHEAPASAVSWPAVLGGAVVGAARAFILLVLGTGLGLSAVSPWAYEGASARNVAIAGIVWMIFTHLCSSAMTGYLAGRMRTRWVQVHTDEVFFRDTANGLIAWAVGVVFTAAVLTSAAGAIVGGAAKATAAGAAAAGATAAAAQPQDSRSDTAAYFVDMLLRSDQPRQPDDAAIRQELGRIVAGALKQGEVPSADRQHIVQVVAARTGLPPADAEKRVADVTAQAKAAEAKAREAADAARKAAAHMSMWTFIALLIGAFTASFMATVGGKGRDGVHRLP